MAEYILEMNSITKTFPGVKALDNVNLKVKRVRFMRLSEKMEPVNRHL